VSKHRHLARAERSNAEDNDDNENHDTGMQMSPPSLPALLTEVWAEYGVSMLVITLRFFARWKMFGFHKFDLGDVFAGFAMVCYSLAAAGTLCCAKNSSLSLSIGVLLTRDDRNLYAE
jgi:hypothetical protein